MAKGTGGRADVVPLPASDAALSAFVQSLELATVALYAKAATVLGSPAASAAAVAFVAHHQRHAREFGVLAGSLAVPGPNRGVLAALQPLTPLASERDALAFLYALEGRVAATHQYLLGRVTATSTVIQIAATLPVECQHAVMLGMLLSLPLAQVAPTAQGTDGHLNPEQYPVA